MTFKETLARQSELQNLYCDNLQKIKWRTNAIMDIITQRVTTTYLMTNIEFCALQIRKILELIAFSSLISDMDVYKQQLKNIAKMWNAKRILNDIEKINPDFYPKPILIDPNNKMLWQDFKEPYLTKDKFVSVYEKCSALIHENSPFETDEQIRDKAEEAVKNMVTWMNLIRNLLNTHTVQLYNEPRLFYFSMGKLDQKPVGCIFERIGEVK